MRYLIYGFVAVLCLAMVAAVHVKKVKTHSWYPLPAAEPLHEPETNERQIATSSSRKWKE